jgi:hypothetical protein
MSSVRPLPSPEDLERLAEPADGTEWPNMDDMAYRGLAGDIARAATKHSEADPVAVLLTLLAVVGIAAGRAKYLRVGDSVHHARLFVALVGDTSRARKGTSREPVVRIVRAAHKAVTERSTAPYPLGLPLNISDGPLSSGEGLVWAIRDPSETINKEGESVDPGVHDKRLMVIEGEFGGALRAAGREGSSLSAILRSAWDGVRLRPLVSGRSRAIVSATDPHVGIVGHVTATELERVLSECDIFNRLANRFLWACVRRPKTVPFPQPMPEDVVASLGMRLADVLTHAAVAGEVGMSDAAIDAWTTVYPELTRDLPGALGGVTARAEAQALRLAQSYALLDRADEIDLPHLQSAIAAWEYCLASANRLFGGIAEDPLASRVLELIRKSGPDGMARTSIRDALGRHVPAKRLDGVLDELAAKRVIRSETIGTPGRSKTVWRAT